MAGAKKPPTSPDKCTDEHCIVVRAHCKDCYVGGWRDNRISQKEAIVADRSECGSLEAGGDNRGDGTQVTPAEWKAVTWIAPLTTSASQRMLTHTISPLRAVLPQPPTHRNTGTYTHTCTHMGAFVHVNTQTHLTYISNCVLYPPITACCCVNHILHGW